MSLLINDMDMPKLGENGDHLWVPSWIEVGKDGKAIICTGTHFDPNTIRSYATEEVPTPHGRLIDADKAENSEVFTIPSKDKSRRFVRHTVICPYYKSSENKPSSIRCEGINNTILKITFESREIRKDHEKQYCCSNYRSCPYASLHKKK